MIILKKFKDPNWREDQTDITFKVHTNELNRDEFIEVLENFMIAVGYHFPDNTHLDIVAHG
jgi:hypothetical protein